MHGRPSAGGLSAEGTNIIYSTSFRRLRTHGRAALRQPLFMILPVFALLGITLAGSYIARMPVGDTGTYAAYARALWHGAWPYRTLPLEYPPGVLPFLLAAVPVSLATGVEYTTGYALVAGGCVWLLLWDIGRTWGGRAVAVAMLLTLVFGRFVFFQLDIFAAAALYGAVRTLKAGRMDWSAVLFAGAVLIKAYPAVCLPALLCFVPKGRRRRYLAVAGATIVAGLLPFPATAPGGLWYSVIYHTGRPPEIMSLAGAAGFILHLFGQPARVAASHASLTLVFPHADTLGTVSDSILAAGWAAAAAALWVRGECRRVGLNCLLLLLIFILFFKVGSPQFLLAALCMLPFAAGELPGQRLRWPLVACLAACVSAAVLLDFPVIITHVSLVSGLLVTTRLAVEGWLLWWAFRRSDAYHAVLRLRSALRSSA